jgi:hypothetical protein
MRTAMGTSSVATLTHMAMSGEHRARGSPSLAHRFATNPDASAEATTRRCDVPIASATSASMGDGHHLPRQPSSARHRRIVVDDAKPPDHRVPSSG